jgi:two-component sensor histidine kinase
VTLDWFRERWSRTTFRVRVGLALALALAPVLLLSLGQSAITFQNQENDQRAELVGAARRSAEVVRTRMEAGQVLLQSLAPSDTGGRCAARLAAIKSRVPDFANLIRFDAAGHVVCSAAPTPDDPGRAGRPWFRTLAAGTQSVITSDPDRLYAAKPALLASARSVDENGVFTGALTAVMTLESLRPASVDSALPPRSQVAIVDVQGDYLTSTDRLAFPSPIRAPVARLTDRSRAPWFADDGRGARRVFTAAPLVGDEVWVVISAPTQGVVAWAWLNPISALVLPLLAFVLAVVVVWSVADRGVVRWIAYLRRIASLYARGRFGVHPVRASHAPPEIRDLAEAMDSMAKAIATRDALVQETLAQKDTMMREIHHRVKNNLQVISSLLNMQQRGLTDPAARAAIQDTRQRISALALIYRALYQGPDLRRVDLGEFLDELIGQIIADAAPRARIRTELHLDPLSIDPDRLAPLALFAVEAITNARKHGLADGGLLEVTLAVEGKTARLDISDTGQGSGAPEMAHAGEGVGRTLMTAFARQLKGELSLTPNAAGGLTTRLIFPTPSPSEAC